MAEKPKVNNAYQLALGLFKQSKNGTAYSPADMPAEFAALKWSLTSIIPDSYDFTNYQVGDTTIETVEKNTITSLSKSKYFESGALTPPTFTFASMLPADAATIVSELDALGVEDAADPYKVLLTAGVWKSTTEGTRTYNVFNACVAILTTADGRTAEAKGTFTGSLALQACHLPIIGVDKCAASLTWVESTGVITLNPSSSGSGNV